ncbi:hypothetical protein Tco_0973946 [Tanacetum coccineum]|uniref:Uncharacterized protein n=1 Tax=Tanacetum coccineum TaxID=301880 RepID=A0ABQ5EA64_9ASTR
MSSPRWTNIEKGIEQHFVKRYSDNKHNLKGYIIEIKPIEIYIAEEMIRLRDLRVDTPTGNWAVQEDDVQRLRQEAENHLAKKSRRPIRRIHQGRYGVSVPALTKDHKRNKDQYAVSRGLNTPYSRYGINIIFWKISNVVLVMDIHKITKTRQKLNKTKHGIGIEHSESHINSGRVLSIQRTRLTPASLKMCMCLKDHLDAKERKQDKCPLETPLDFEEGVFDDEVQQNKAIPLSDEEIALDASSEGTMSPGGPRYDYMLSSEAEDDY